MMKLKWGIIGCGGIADRRTLPGMMLTDNSVPYAVMDADAAVAEKVKEKYGAEYAFNNYEDVLALPDVDVVYIASPVFCHKEQALAAAKAGKHILIEKPIGINLEETLEIIDACKKAGVKLGVGFMMRYHAYHQEMKRFIADGNLGQIVSMRAQFTCWYPEIKGAWRQNKALSGGGALADLGVHCIDLLQYISGLNAVECVGFATTNTFGYNVDDTASLIMKMENGALAYVDCNFNIPDSATKCPIEFYGTKGSMVAIGTLSQEEGGKVEILACPDNAEYDPMQAHTAVQSQALEVEFGNMYKKEIEAFANAVINDTEPPVNAENTLFVHKVIDAIYKNGGGKL